jgi:hypothetical protein
MGLVDWALAMDFRRRWRNFQRACARPVESQLAVLRGLLARAAATEWGRRYGFADIRTPQQYRDRVPVAGYEAAAASWHKAFDGAADVAWPGHVRYFAMSSGTTAATDAPGAGNKYLPVTADAIRSNIRAGGLLMACLAHRGGPRSVTGGRVLYLGGSTVLTARGKCLHGDASGIVARHIPSWVRGRSLPADDIRTVANWQEKIDLIVQRYLTADVCALGACPSWASLLFKQMLKAAEARGLGRRTIGELWPKLGHFISYGMSFQPYRRAFQQYVGRDIHYTSTYSSSEAGMSAIQVDDDGPLRLTVDNGVFYEFIPAGRDRDADGPRLHLGEVRQGEDYSVLVSTNGGIWAYPLGDVVRFEGLSPPRIVFAGRTQLQLSAFGEHVTLGMIEKAVASACERTGATVADYTIAPRYPCPDSPVPAHRWIVEFDRPPADEAAFIAAADQSIRRENEDYDTHRTGDYGLLAPQLVKVAPRTFYEWMKAKGKLGGQHKVPRVAMSPEMAEELLEISRRLGR